MTKHELAKHVFDNNGTCDFGIPYDLHKKTLCSSCFRKIGKIKSCYVSEALQEATQYLEKHKLENMLEKLGF